MIDTARIKDVLGRHGRLRHQRESDWEGPFLLPQAVSCFYREIGPVDITIEGYGNPYFLPSLSRLRAFQAGYRYLPSDDWYYSKGGDRPDPTILEAGGPIDSGHGRQGDQVLQGSGNGSTPLEGWMANWLVVADEGGDPFIFDDETGQILYDVHGRGKWSPKPLFGSISEMAGCLGLIGSVVLDAGEDLTDDLSYITREHMLVVMERLEALLESRTRATYVLAELGWATG